jgi:hypothetical protein
MVLIRLNKKKRKIKNLNNNRPSSLYNDCGIHAVSPQLRYKLALTYNIVSGLPTLVQRSETFGGQFFLRQVSPSVNLVGHQLNSEIVCVCV